MGANGQYDLLGKLYAAGKGCALSKGITLYISPNTNDNDEWQSTIKHIAIEGHCYFINCDMYFTRDTYPADLQAQDEIAKLPEKCAAAAAVLLTLTGITLQNLYGTKKLLFMPSLI